MAIRNAKLVSVRLYPEVNDAIEEFCKGHKYWKRSDVINRMLHAAFTNMTPSDVYDMVRWSSYNQNKVDCKFEITKELKTPKRD